VFLVGENTWKTDRTFVFKVGTSVDAGAIIGLMLKLGLNIKIFVVILIYVMIFLN